MKTVKLKDGTVVKVVYPEEVEFTLTQEDKEMDARRAKQSGLPSRNKNFLKI